MAFAPREAPVPRDENMARRVRARAALLPVALPQFAATVARWSAEWRSPEARELVASSTVCAVLGAVADAARAVGKDALAHFFTARHPDLVFLQQLGAQLAAAEDAQNAEEDGGSDNADGDDEDDEDEDEDAGDRDAFMAAKLGPNASSFQEIVDFLLKCLAP